MAPSREQVTPVARQEPDWVRNRTLTLKTTTFIPDSNSRWSTNPEIWWTARRATSRHNKYSFYFMIRSKLSTVKLRPRHVASSLSPEHVFWWNTNSRPVKYFEIRAFHFFTSSLLARFWSLMCATLRDWRKKGLSPTLCSQPGHWQRKLSFLRSVKARTKIHSIGRYWR